MNALNIVTINGRCKWTAKNSSQTLDLSCLSGKVLTTTEQNMNGDIIADYSFSICANTQSCGQDNVMATQHPKNLPGRCFNVGTFDPSINPEFSDQSGGAQWVFTYLGDPTDCPSPGRQWIPTFICDQATEYSIGVVQESRCAYSVPIRTKVSHCML